MAKRITVALYIVLFLFGIFVFRLWYLQVLKGGEYKKIDEQNRLRVLDIPAPRGIIYDRNGNALVRNILSFDITALKEDVPGDSQTLVALSRLLDLKPDAIKEKLGNGSSMPFKPVVLKRDVSFEDVARVDARKMDFPGIQTDVIVSREYLYRKAASHVIGYLGRLSIGQLRSPEYSDVPQESFIGQFGIEKVYDPYLRGVAGKKIIEVNAMGSVVKVVRIQQPVKGEDIQLTIDINLQSEAEQSLAGKTGAIVALDPNNGEILVLASSPSFDPNVFSRGVDVRKWNRLMRDPKKPLLNRAIQSQYPPGSTFKIISALAALEDGLVTKNTDYYCNGSIFFGRTFRCWKYAGHGEVRLHEAIVESCDVYFYEIGKKINVDRLAQYAFGFGLGRPTGLELEGEVAGIVPTSGWKMETKGEKWFTGETLNTVIGQGYLSATPVQMARLMAAIVNGGKLYRPHLFKRPGKGIEPESIVRLKPENIDLIKKALLGVVEDDDGTGLHAKSEIVTVGGKTGTTQVVGGVRKGEDIPEKYRDHAWFVAYAPVVDPEIALAVFVEHGGHGSTGAAPIAKKIIERYYEKEANIKNKLDES
jgi:penicillin-binding protein 2